MLLHFEVDAAKFRVYGVAKRNLQRHMREALEAMGREWHQRYLPLHFLFTAFTRYGYTRRKGMGMNATSKAWRRSYAGRKWRKYRTEDPLTFTGASKLEALGPIKLRGTSKEIRVVLPRVFNLRNPKSRVNMREEITRLLPAEIQTLIEVGRRTLRQAIARPL